jgi:AAA+ superfamily predicted ATPase
MTKRDFQCVAAADAEGEVSDGSDGVNGSTSNGSNDNRKRKSRFDNKPLGRKPQTVEFYNIQSLLNLFDEPKSLIPIAPIVKKCSGKYCDHMEESQLIPLINAKFYNLAESNYMLTLDDLIEIGLCYHCKLQTAFYSISLERLSDLVDPLTELKQMIGLHKVKKNIVEQIVYFLQDLEPNPVELLHTVIDGPPGVGKTQLARILGKIYLKMGYLKTDKFKTAKRSELIGKYLGSSASQTQAIIDEALGGVLFIDEAYSLGNAEKRDSFSKECIDTINQNLTERAGEFICIIAGYKDELDSCFFSYNQGLKSRFRFRYSVEGYNADELSQIFVHKVNLISWQLEYQDQVKSLFEQNKSHFVSFGRDIETLLYHIKIVHSNRVFFSPNDGKKKINDCDLVNGFNRFKVSNSKNEESNAMSEYIRSVMYT